MSRVPRPSASNSNLRTQCHVPAASATSPRTRKVSSPATPTRLRPPGAAPTKSRPTSPFPTTKREVAQKEMPEPPKLSLKEQIALKRAEAKKAQVTHTPGLPDDALDAMPTTQKANDDLVELGRWSIRETIERARNTGNLNLSSRSLPCVPSCLFEIHLGVTPEPLESVIEPEYPASASPKKNRSNKQQPSWFEAQDLVVLKVRTNDIVAIQPELALFGSLKVIDFHSNQLKTLPSTLTILSSLTTLDISNNNLTEFSPALFSLPALLTLNLAHNQLKSLSFARWNDPLETPRSLSIDGFYQPKVNRSTQPLPNLQTLDVGSNKLTGDGIDSAYLPRSITHITLSHNPLGPSRDLISGLAKLENLQEAKFECATIMDDSFVEPPIDAFPKLQLLDLTETQVREQAVRSFLANSPRSNSLNFNLSMAPPSPEELRVAVGKRIIKEAWEIEAEQRYLKKKKIAVEIFAEASESHVLKEPWELEAERGLTTEGGRRRARAAATAATATTTASEPSQVKNESMAPKSKPVEKEQWEIEAEQGVLTEGGRRRFRAQQAAAAASSVKPPEERPRKLSSPSSPTSLSSSKYYSVSTLTLTLPPSAPPSRSHMRAFSTLAMPQNDRSAEDLLVPTPTLPLTVILQQEFAPKLQVLILSNRRADPIFSFPSPSSFSIPHASGGILPRLGELILDGCGLGDMVPILHESNDSGAGTIEKRGLIDVISETFPWLTMLDLSYNNLSSDGLSPPVIERLLVPSEGRKGLKVLRLRGNRLTSLDAFEQVAGLFRGNRRVSDWGFEELDVRDNEISKVSPLLGLIPMDVFLVDGNIFRVPPRKVWEREGTKGLLSWLRGRIE